MMDLSANEIIRMLHSTSVTIIVKPAHEIDFQIALPKDLLTARCSRFRELIDEGANGSLAAEHPTFMPQPRVVIRGYSAQAFKIFTFWLYNNVLPSRVEENDSPTFRPLNLNRSRLRDFLEAWLLFDYLCLPEQQNMAMSQLCAIVEIVRQAPDMIFENDVQLIGQNHQHPQLYQFICEVLTMSVIGGTLDADKVRGVLIASGMSPDVMEYCSVPAVNAQDFQNCYSRTQIAAWNGGHSGTGLGVQV